MARNNNRHCDNLLFVVYKVYKWSVVPKLPADLLVVLFYGGGITNFVETYEHLDLTQLITNFLMNDNVLVYTVV